MNVYEHVEHRGRGDGVQNSPVLPTSPPWGRRVGHDWATEQQSASPGTLLLLTPLGHRKTDPFSRSSGFLHSLAIQWVPAMCQALLSAPRIQRLTKHLQSVCDGQNNRGAGGALLHLLLQKARVKYEYGDYVQAHITTNTKAKTALGASGTLWGWTVSPFYLCSFIFSKCLSIFTFELHSSPRNSTA